MLWSYKIYDKLFNFGLNIINFGKKDEVVLHKVNKNTKLFIRPRETDSLVMGEVWEWGDYNKPDFLIKPSDTIVDIGAHIGTFSVYAAQKATSGKVFAYEPDLKNFKLLKKNKNINKLKNLHVFNVGVMDKVRQNRLNLWRRNSANHSIYASDSKKYTVFKSTTLEKIMAKTGKINYLKIDSEGAEYPILFGTNPKVFTKIDKIIVEYHDYFDHGRNFKEIVSLLKKNKFNVSLGGIFLFRKMFGFGIIKAIKT
jgi:FkbM family methyltransferase